MRAFSLSGLTLSLLGVLHLLAHFSLPPEDAPPVIAQMEQTTIELMGTHTLLQFHVGFSVTMGALMIAYGGMMVLVGAEPVRPAVLRLHTVICAVMVGLTVLYFHPLAWGMCLLALAMAVVSLVPTAQPA